MAIIWQPKLPTTAEEWELVHRKSLSSSPNEAKSYECLILNILFGDEYLLGTIDLLIAQMAHGKREVHEPIEKLLRAVSSPAVRRYLLDLCFHSQNNDAIETACLLLPSLAQPDIWRHLPQLANSPDPRIRRCGIAVCEEISRMYVMSSSEVEQAANLFRELDDPYIAELLKRIDAIATTMSEEYGR